MEQQERLKLIINFQEKYKNMTDEDLEWERFFGGHDYGKGRGKEDEQDNNYSGIQYDCACIELNKRGLYDFGKFDENILDRIKGNYDYHKAIGGE